MPRYIGRIGLRDDNYDVLLIDWRAPAAAVFYQATQADPQGVVRRRILRSKGVKVLGVEDDLLDAEAETDLPIVGEGALLAQLTRARDRSMHSIVATIQAEQDRAIRAPNKGVVSISGGPGTGKTVVALHRAAYLLYADRRRYETGGVLVVGPSGVFMRYIERVLPSLGETAVALRSLGEVVDGVRATRRDDPAVAEVKGSLAMAELLRRTARQAVPDAPREFRVFYRDDVIHLGSRELGAIRRQLLSMGRRNRSTTKVASTLIDAMWRQVRGERGRERTKEDFAEEMRTNDEFLEFAVVLVAGARRRRRCWAGCATPSCSPGSARACSTTSRCGCSRSRGADAALGGRRGAARRAALPARRPADRQHRLGRRRVPRRRGRLPPRGVHRLRPGVRRPPRAGPRRPTGSRTTGSRTCSSTRRRT